MRRIALALTITIGLIGCSDDAATGTDSFVAKDGSVAKDIAGKVDSKGQKADSKAANVFSIPLANVTTTAKFYTHKTKTNVDVKFFAVMGSDGAPHVAFDACDVCYKAKLGYKQLGTVMQCRNCGRKFPINSIGTKNKGGGCWPGFVPKTVTKTSVQILHKDIATGAKYF